MKWDDELVKATALTKDGAVIHPNFQPKGAEDVVRGLSTRHSGAMQRIEPGISTPQFISDSGFTPAACPGMTS